MRTGELVIYPYARAGLACGIVLSWSFSGTGGGTAIVRTLTTTEDGPRWRRNVRTVSVSTLLAWQRSTIREGTRCQALLLEAQTVLDQEQTQHSEVR
jgi:hypothetical protein